MPFPCLGQITYLDISGGNVGGGVTAELGMSFPEIPMPCSCSGRSEEDLNCRPAIFVLVKLYLSVEEV